MGKELESYRQRKQPVRSHVAGMSLVCSRNEQEARVTAIKGGRGRVAVNDIGQVGR